MRYFKLLEILGLTLILGAWFLSWNSKWNDAYNSYRDFMLNFSYALHETSDAAGRQFQFALTRAVQGTNLNPDDFASAYKVGWKFSEVRKEWFNFATVRIRNTEILLKNISDIADKYKLNLPSDFKTVEKARLEIFKDLKASIDFDNSDNKIVPIPSENSLSPYQAGDINQKISELIPHTIVPINELYDTIKRKKRLSSLIYSLFFAGGSILVIVAKYTEWRQELFVRRK